MTKAMQVRPAPLPETSDELVAQWPNALVDRVRHLMLNGAWKDMRPYLNTTCAEDSVQGSVPMDRAGAAMVLQKAAQRDGDELVAKLGWKELDCLIGKVARKGKFGRSQRIKEAAQQMMLPTMSDEQPVTDNG